MGEKLVREWKKVFVADLPYIAKELREETKPKAVIFLEGPMGAGKTTFAKAFVQDGETLSPSYSVLSETNEILHGDFYRLKDPEEIYHLELPLYLEEKNYFLLEWGHAHLRPVSRELPENFALYKLDISVNSSAQNEDDDKASFSRNFLLYELSEE